MDESGIDAALLKAVCSGLPVARVARGNTGGFAYPGGPYFIAGSNLSSTKARLLLQASLYKLGTLPACADPEAPTAAELAAIAAKVVQFQAIFDSH